MTDEVITLIVYTVKLTRMSNDDVVFIPGDTHVQDIPAAQDIME